MAANLPAAGTPAGELQGPAASCGTTGGKNHGGRVVGAGRARRSVSGGGCGVVRKQGAGAREARLHHPPASRRTGERGAPERRSGSSRKIVRREGVHESENNPGNRV